MTIALRYLHLVITLTYIDIMIRNQIELSKSFNKMVDRLSFHYFMNLNIYKIT